MTLHSDFDYPLNLCPVIDVAEKLVEEHGFSGAFEIAKAIASESLNARDVNAYVFMLAVQKVLEDLRQ